MAIGPLVLVLLSAAVGLDLEPSVPRRARDHRRGIDHAPSLRNYIERQTYPS